MNFVGHVVAASGQSRAPDLLLGAALPDLLPTSRLDHDGMAPGVAEGVDHHRRADAAFHDDRRFRDLTAAVRAALADGGVARGPSRAAAHAGVELLLDGVLLDDPDATATFGEVWTRLGDPDATVVTVVAAGDRPRWREWLAVLTTELDPAGYGRPEVVARRLERLLARRPRLALAAGDRAVVADALRAVRDRVHEVGPTLVAEVSAAARVAPAG